MTKAQDGQAKENRSLEQRPSRASRFQGKYKYNQKYQQVPNSDRLFLLDLIHRQGMMINKAARRCNIPYENAKLINKIYMAEGRKARLNAQHA